MLITSERSVLAVVDVQERLAPAVHDVERVVRNAAILMKAARELGVPMLVSEQYPKGLGHTVAPIRDLVHGGAVIEKIAFSCMADPVFADRMAALDRDQVIVCGIEAHVCVLQTCMGLLDAGKRVFVAADAVSSRVARNAELALDRLRGCGVEIVSTEMVVFEWMQRAGTPVFKTLSALIR